LGFSPHNVVRVSLGGPRQVFVDALDRLRQRPDVLAAGAVGSIPFSGMNSDVGVQVNSVRSAAAGIQVLPGYFEATGIPLIRGRLLAPQDLQMEPDAAVVSEAAGRMLFGDRDPVGATFEDSRGTRRFRVVGVVGNVRQSLGTSNERPQAYVMPEGVPSFLRGLVVRLRDRRHAALAEIEADLRTVTPKVSNPAWWSDAIADVTAYRNPRFQTLVLGTFAFLALGVTALGIFAVVGHQVVSRTREMGVRLAIGAAPRSLVRLVVGQTIVPVVLGLAGGLVLIHWARGLAEAQLYQVDTRDPWTLATAAAAVLIAALLAAYLPARRATRIDPVAVLRAD
jgi:hypothetical protein